MVEEKSSNSISVNEQTAKHLWKIGNQLASTCPSASRFYIFNLERKLIADPKLLENSSKRNFQYCNHCGSLWEPGNHRVRIHPPSRPNRHIKKLLRLEADEPWKLNNRQKKKLRKFKEATSKIVYTCFLCKKKAIFPGESKTHRNQNLKLNQAIIPKVKYKKGDLNAGLFITSSTIKKACELNVDEHSKSFNQETSKGLLPRLSLEDNSKSSNEETSKVRNSSAANVVSDSFYKHPVIKPDKALKEEIVQISQPGQSTKKKSVPSDISSVKEQKAIERNRKRRKTLLAQILNEEKNINKKPSLASFLVSL